MSEERKIFSEKELQKISIKKTNFRLLNLLKALVVVIAVIAISYSGMNFYSTITTNSNAIEFYNTYDVNMGTIQNKLILSGNVINNDDLLVKCKTDCVIKEINVKVGDEVTNGTVLATLDFSEIQEEVKQLNISIQNMQLNLEKIKNERLIDQAEYNYNVELKNQEITEISNDISDLEKLLETGGVAKNEITDCLQEIESIKNELDYLSEVNELRQRVYEVEYETIENEISANQIRVKLMNDKLINSEIISDYDGIVKEICISQGQTLNRNEKSFVIFQPKEFVLELNVPQQSINLINIGQEVLLTFSNGEEKIGEISNKSNMIVNESNGNYMVAEIALNEDAENTILSGVTFTAQVILSEKNNIITIPRGDYLNTSNLQYVFRITDEDTRAEKVEIVTGIYDENAIEIVEGLNVADQIIISSYDDFKEMDSVGIQ